MSKLNEGKKMRTAAMVFCGAMLTVLPAMAQQDAPPPPPAGQTQGPPPGGPHGRGGMNPEHRLEMMQRELNLTPDQSAQVKGILDTGRGKAESLRADPALSQDDKRMKMMEMMKHESEQIRSLLTPDQQPKYDAMVAKQRERMQERRGGGPDGPPPSSPQQ